MMSKKTLFTAVFLSLLFTGSAQIRWSLSTQTKASFSKSLGYFEDQQIRHESTQQWLFGEAQLNRWIVRFGPSFGSYDMGEALYGFCGTPPVPTYTAMENRLGFDLALGFDLLKHEKHDLIASVGLQQMWVTKRFSGGANDFMILPVFIEEASFYAGSNVSIEYRYHLGQHWLIGAQVGGAYLFGEGEFPRVSPWKMTSSLSIGYRF